MNVLTCNSVRQGFLWICEKLKMFIFFFFFFKKGGLLITVCFTYKCSFTFWFSFESAWGLNNDAISMDKIHLQTSYGSNRNGELYRSEGQIKQVKMPQLPDKV